jgi:hypothetical protein
MKSMLVKTHKLLQKEFFVSPFRLTQNRSIYMTKEVVKHRKDEKKKPALTPKEKKAKKQEKKQSK